MNRNDDPPEENYDDHDPNEGDDDDYLYDEPLFDALNDPL